MSLVLKTDSFYDRNLIDVLSVQKVIDSNLKQETFFSEMLETLRGRSSKTKRLGGIRSRGGFTLSPTVLTENILLFL